MNSVHFQPLTDVSRIMNYRDLITDQEEMDRSWEEKEEYTDPMARIDDIRIPSDDTDDLPF